jgi:hypothetical protein
MPHIVGVNFKTLYPGNTTLTPSLDLSNRLSHHSCERLIFHDLIITKTTEINLRTIILFTATFCSSFLFVKEKYTLHTYTIQLSKRISFFTYITNILSASAFVTLGPDEQRSQKIQLNLL